MTTCPTCRGDGELYSTHRFDCVDCKGTGKVTEAERKRLLAEERRLHRNERDYP